MLDYYLVSNLHLGDQGRQFTLGLSLIRICFPFYETFSLIPYVFNQKFYANRLNVLMCPWPCWSDLQTSNLLQTSSLNISSARQQRVWISTRRLLPSRWAGWGDMRPPSRDEETCCVALVLKESSSFSKPPIVHTYPQETRTCAVLFMFDSTNVRILQASKSLRDIENFPWKLNEQTYASTSFADNSETKMPRFQFWKRKTATSRQMQG